MQFLSNRKLRPSFLLEPMDLNSMGFFFYNLGNSGYITPFYQFMSI